jgi:hypothetical protein
MCVGYTRRVSTHSVNKEGYNCGQKEKGISLYLCGLNISSKHFILFLLWVLHLCNHGNHNQLVA